MQTPADLRFILSSMKTVHSSMNEIICGDSLIELKKFADKSVDLICTDPPYNFDREQKENIHKELCRVAKAVIVFSPPENQWIKPDQYGFWIKPISTKNTSRRYSRFVEMIFFSGELRWNAQRHWSQYTNVFTDLVDGETDHPFEKPTSLIKRLVLNHTNIGDTILDPFCGSGTIPLVAKQLGRNYLGIDISEEYCEIARQRIKGQSSPLL